MFQLMADTLLLALVGAVVVAILAMGYFFYRLGQTLWQEMGHNGD